MAGIAKQKYKFALEFIVSVTDYVPGVGQFVGEVTVVFRVTVVVRVTTAREVVSA